MPIQAPQWTDYLNCPVCCREFGAPPRSPISLGCGHTLCRHCIKHLHRKQCPFDQTAIQQEGEELVVNTALLQLAGYSPPTQPYHPPCIQALPEADRQAYDVIVRCMEHLAVYLKYCGNANSNISGCRLSRPMQRKLVTLLQCSMMDEEGRGRAARAARSLGERTVTELILQHQNPQQLSANLWAAVRARGCQFLGPAMQEEVLKLVLLALEDGSALSRKVLVMFVVQRLEPHFPQASKTSIGHVVQLLYRASCFKVSKRECDSSLMQLKEEFRTYESLRREHDAQIVQIATEAGLRIAPDQWSALLYGDATHKSHMQSIIDKLQTPQSFAQSVQELFIALQRTGDPAHLGAMSLHLDYLASIDASPDAKSPTWQQLADTLCALREVVSSLSHYLQQQAIPRDTNHNKPHETAHTHNQPSPSATATTPTHNRYKVSLCRDAATRSFCPRGNSCTFAHSEEELERYRSAPNQAPSNGNFAYIPLPAMQPIPPTLPQHVPQHASQHASQQLSRSMPHLPVQMYPRYQVSHTHVDNFNMPAGLLAMPSSQTLQPEVAQITEFADNMQPTNFPTPVLPNQPPLAVSQNDILVSVTERPYYDPYNIASSSTFQEGSNHFLPEFTPPVYNNYQSQVNGYQGQASGYQGQANEYQGQANGSQGQANGYQGQANGYQGQANGYQGQANGYQEGMSNLYLHEREVSPYSFQEMADFCMKQGFPIVQLEQLPEPTWPPNANDVFNFEGMRNTLTQCSTSTDDIFNVSGDRLAVSGAMLQGAERQPCVMETSELFNMADDIELEEELQALERRIDTEFKSTD